MWLPDPTPAGRAVVYGGLVPRYSECATWRHALNMGEDGMLRGGGRDL